MTKEKLEQQNTYSGYEAETKKFSEFADAFYEIAKCKMSCAESLHHRLMMYGYDPHKQSEIEDRFDRAKHAFRRL